MGGKLTIAQAAAKIAEKCAKSASELRAELEELHRIEKGETEAWRARQEAKRKELGKGPAEAAPMRAPKATVKHTDAEVEADECARKALEIRHAMTAAVARGDLVLHDPRTGARRLPTDSVVDGVTSILKFDSWLESAGYDDQHRIAEKRELPEQDIPIFSRTRANFYFNRDYGPGARNFRSAISRKVIRDVKTEYGVELSEVYMRKDILGPKHWKPAKR